MQKCVLDLCYYIKSNDLSETNERGILNGAVLQVTNYIDNTDYLFNAICLKPIKSIYLISLVKLIANSE